MNITPKCCNTPAIWITNGVTEKLQYWYCTACKSEVSKEVVVKQEIDAQSDAYIGRGDIKSFSDWVSQQLAKDNIAKGKASGILTGRSMGPINPQSFPRSDILDTGPYQILGWSLPKNKMPLPGSNDRLRGLQEEVNRIASQVEESRKVMAQPKIEVKEWKEEKMIPLVDDKGTIWAYNNATAIFLGYTPSQLKVMIDYYIVNEGRAPAK